jgi:hypothetical protein
MFNQGRDAVGHESTGAHDATAPRNVSYRHDVANDGNLNAPARVGGADLVRSRFARRVNDDLDSVASHDFTCALHPVEPSSGVNDRPRPPKPHIVD